MTNSETGVKGGPKVTKVTESDPLLDPDLRGIWQKQGSDSSRHPLHTPGKPGSQGSLGSPEVSQRCLRGVLERAQRCLRGVLERARVAQAGPGAGPGSPDWSRSGPGGT